MVDKKTTSDDEYQFPASEYVTPNQQQRSGDTATGATQPETPPTRRFHFPEIRNKRIVWVIAVVIIAVIFIRILNSDRAPVVKPKLKPTVQQPVVQSQPDNGLLNSLDALRAHSSRTETQIQTLQSQVSNMQSQLEQAREDNRQLRQTVSDLSAQVEELTGKLNQVIAQLHVSPQKTPSIVFHLRAVVPDRAWVISNKGETLTVTAGDHLEGYGTVRTIDAKNGVILTSSGRKIVYGPNDF